MFYGLKIWVRGAGELASACGHIMHSCGFDVILSELPNPLAIRRSVTFSDAIITGSSEVEAVTARYCQRSDVEQVLKDSEIPLLTDDLDAIRAIGCPIVVDARMLKKEIGSPDYGRAFIIGLGPGFTVGENCHAIIETKRSHDLGRILWSGKAIPNSGIPGELGGKTYERILSAPCRGKVQWKVDFGNLVKENELVGRMDGLGEIHAPIAGIVRGLISPETIVEKGFKIGDIDPRGKSVNAFSISDKARLVGRGILEAILQFLYKSER